VRVIVCVCGYVQVSRTPPPYRNIAVSCIALRIRCGWMFEGWGSRCFREGGAWRWYSRVSLLAICSCMCVCVCISCLLLCSASILPSARSFPFLLSLRSLGTKRSRSNQVGSLKKPKVRGAGEKGGSSFTNHGWLTSAGFSLFLSPPFPSPLPLHPPFLSPTCSPHPFSVRFKTLLSPGYYLSCRFV